MADWAGLGGAGGQLALQIMQRQNEAKDLYDRLATEGRARAQANLSRFGTPDEAFMADFANVADPATAQAKARADALKDYLVGLPANLIAGTGGGGGGYGRVQPTTGNTPWDYILAGLGLNQPATPTRPTRPAGLYGSADVMERQLQRRPVQPPPSAIRPEYL